ncbi:hypothetical protein SEA_MAGRITTE_237 [Microbacterium phage Magritte]|nr:hypothetical protein SEA_MAGRITTE_237 [Microbacterium phage Magritte]
MGIDNENEFGPDLTPDGSVSKDAAETLPESSWDAGQIDAGDVDWKATAETLQQRVNELDDQLAAQKTYPFEDGDVIVLGPEIFSAKDGSVLNWKGVNYVPQKVKDMQPKELKAYSVGEAVEVQKFGNWVPGRITSKQAGILNVDTEVGPVGVGSYHIIRKVEQGG